MRAAPRLVLATANPGKVRELRELLAPAGVECVSLLDLPGFPRVEETGQTYLENATLKARAIATWSGLPALADDSGLEVDALDGRPGVHSAYFAGPKASDHDNVAKLLDELRGIPPERRTARFRCVLVVARPDGALLAEEGVCEGRITSEPKGEDGFGYDPVFFHPPTGKTFAQLSREEKNQYSHRARAAAKLCPKLRAFLCGDKPDSMPE